jgi:predicted CoA-binding protein
MPLEDDKDIAALLRASPRIAMIGASARPDRAAYRVMHWLLDHGFAVIPVNPTLAGKTIHGQPVVGSLKEIAPPVDLVDIFRNSEAAGEAVDAAIAHGAKAVWLQLGVINPDAVTRAEAAGLNAVMDRCIKVDGARLNISHPCQAS